MANYVLTTSPQEVGSNLSVTVGGRLLAWYSNPTATGATVHLLLQAISQGLSYTGTNKDYELTLDNTTTGTVAWSYAPLPADTWVDVAQVTQTVNFGTTVNVSGKVWTYVYGDAWVTGNTVTMPSLYVPPSGLSISVNEVYTNGAKFDASISSYGSPSDKANRYIEAGILSANNYFTDPRRYAPSNATLSDTITVDNNSPGGTLTIEPNTQYYYGMYADNYAEDRPGVSYSSTVAGQFVTKAEAPTITLGTINQTTAEINYATTADGNVYSKTIEYSIDGGTTWVTGATVSSGSATTGSFIISGLAAGTTYILKNRTSTTAGATDGTDVSFTTVGAAALYGSVNGQTKKVIKLYGSVNGQTKKITKLYGSVNGQTKLIYQAQ